MQIYDFLVRNVVSTADLGQPIEITKFNEFEWGRYDVVNNYNGCVGYVKDKLMEGRTTVFLSGKLISTGAKSLRKSALQLYRTKEILVQEDFIQDVPIEPRIRNIVATVDFKEPIDFPNIIRRKTVNYEPDQFPGLIYKSSVGTTSLIFSSGKVVIAGSKSEEQIIASIQDLIELIRPRNSLLKT